MIYFFTTVSHQYTISVFIQFVKNNSISICPYGSNIDRITKNDVVIFCDLDRFNDELLVDAKILYDQIEKIGCQILNNPYVVMRRYDLCRSLYEIGINSFNVHHTNAISTMQYPVFLREEFEHNGPLSYLLHDKEAVDFTLKNLTKTQDLMCSEFVDVSDSELGLFHKYSAFYINGKILPRHFFIAEDWNVKGSVNSTEPITLQLEIEYLNLNPHKLELENIFKHAKIEYGRIDYAVTFNGIQVFEINTNPTIIDQGDLEKSNARFKAVTALFIKNLSRQLEIMANSNSQNHPKT